MPSRLPNEIRNQADSNCSPRTRLRTKFGLSCLEPDFTLLWIKSRKAIDLCAVVEIGVYEPYEALVDTAKGWLQGRHIGLVILVKNNEEPEWTATEAITSSKYANEKLTA